MRSRRVQYVILCEDQKSRDFLRRFLKRRGASGKSQVTDHDIHSYVSPPGEGSGAQYVLRRYAERMALLRRAHTNQILLVMVDADSYTVRQRIDQLSSALAAIEEQPRRSDEPVALLIPKRNIQTWIEHLRADPPAPVQEDDPYPEPEQTARRDYWAPAVDRLVAFLSIGATWPDCPPSLDAARPEFNRIP